MRQPGPSLRWWRGLWAAVLLLGMLARLAAPSMAMDLPQTMTAGDSLAALLDGGAICHAFEDGQAPKGPTPANAPDHHAPDHHAHDCGLCPACHSVGAPALLSHAATIAPPSAVAMATSPTLPPPATGPPARIWTPARPRDPPPLRV